MVIELREKGDRLIIYTDNKSVYRSLSKWKQVLHKVSYFDRNGKRVAADLYFDKSMKNVLTEVANGQLPLNL